MQWTLALRLILGFPLLARFKLPLFIPLRCLKCECLHLLLADPLFTKPLAPIM